MEAKTAKAPQRCWRRLQICIYRHLHVERYNGMTHPLQKQLNCECGGVGVGSGVEKAGESQPRLRGGAKGAPSPASYMCRHGQIRKREF